jgi:flagellum-specific peptidoglycan hydrolase FlgJ
MRLSFSALILLPFFISAQPPRIQHFEYIDQFADEAVNQMSRFHIPASVILAQAIFESGAGQSELAQRSNNHFGIKCHGQWSGDTVVKHDDALNECFRKYESVLDSYTDHSIFIATRKWYTQLFSIPLTDYRGWCRGLKAAGYATFPNYADELIHIIEENRLYELDRVVRLQPKTLASAEAEIDDPTMRADLFNLKDFAKYRLLFTDEREIYLRSLDLIIREDYYSDELVSE